MGLAFVGTPCTGDKPCAINEDSGLVLSTVVAHEMGHVYVLTLYKIINSFDSNNHTWSETSL